jgi:hypothetical protein
MRDETDITNVIITRDLYARGRLPGVGSKFAGE